MNIDNVNDQAQLNSMLYHDNSALATIKNSNDQQGALETVAGQFEAMFLQMVLRQMRSSSDVMAAEDSPFSSQQQGVFRDMYDGQLAIELSKNQSSGIADMLVQQLSPSMREVAFESARHVTPANDTKPTSLQFEKKLEEVSHSSARTPLTPETSVNPAVSEVALTKQGLGEGSLTNAFSQPLNRKMEP
jgi:flagellar protein FlgJ